MSNWRRPSHLKVRLSVEKFFVYMKVVCKWWVCAIVESSLFAVDDLPLHGLSSWQGSSWFKQHPSVPIAFVNGGISKHPASSFDVSSLTTCHFCLESIIPLQSRDSETPVQRKGSSINRCTFSNLCQLVMPILALLLVQPSYYWKVLNFRMVKVTSLSCSSWHYPVACHRKRSRFDVGDGPCKHVVCVPHQSFFSLMEL